MDSNSCQNILRVSPCIRLFNKLIRGHASITGPANVSAPRNAIDIMPELLVALRPEEVQVVSRADADLHRGEVHLAERLLCGRLCCWVPQVHRRAVVSVVNKQAGTDQDDDAAHRRVHGSAVQPQMGSMAFGVYQRSISKG